MVPEETQGGRPSSEAACFFPLFPAGQFEGGGAAFSPAPYSPRPRPRPSPVPSAPSSPASVPPTYPRPLLLRPLFTSPPTYPRPSFAPPPLSPAPVRAWGEGGAVRGCCGDANVYAPARRWGSRGSRLQPRAGQLAALAAPTCTQVQPERPLQVKVVGLFRSSSFQIAKTAAENLKNQHPSKFEDPIIVPLQEFAWDQYLQERKRELKSEVWAYYSHVMCFVNDKLLGDASELQKWAHKVWNILEFKAPALYEALTVDFSAKFLRETKHKFVYLDISIDFNPVGRLIFELFSDACPKTCKNFQLLCSGKSGFSPSGIRLHYVGSIFHRVVPNGWIQGGDIVAGRGDGGESIYGPTFEDENFSIPHNKRGVLGMVNKGRHSNASQFYITLQPTPYLDKKYVAFGQLIEGTGVLQRLELVPTENERPIQQCIIIDSGVLQA